MLGDVIHLLVLEVFGMFSALYYPHTSLSTSDLAGERILKRALLMWDHLEFMVPTPHFKPWYGDPLVAEAIELIGKNHYPSDEEKTEAHNQIEEFVTRPNLPEAFYYRGFDDYEVYPQKFLPDTWELLEESGHAGPLLEDLDRPLSNPFGHAIMAILADCCAGSTRSRVTDRAPAYASLAGLLADNSENSLRDRLVDMDLRTLQGEESFISLRLSLPDIDSLSLDQLLAFRKREESEKGHDFRKLRHNYVARIEQRIKEVTTNAQLTKSDIEELERQFFQESMDDLAGLKEELGFEFKDIAKDVVVTVLAGAGTLAASLFPDAAPILTDVVKATGAPLMIGGAVSAGNKFFKARAETLRRHPMALLYELQDW
jgi:hypothetical protein